MKQDKAVSHLIKFPYVVPEALLCKNGLQFRP